MECQLGTGRRLTEINGHEAVKLWRRYVSDHNEDALAMLLEHNKEDMLNLKMLKERLL